MRFTQIGWEKAGITYTICLGLSNLPLTDPFDEMDPMLQVSTVPSDQHQLITISKLTFDEIQMAHPNPYIKKKITFLICFLKNKKRIIGESLRSRRKLFGPFAKVSACKM